MNTETTQTGAAPQDGGATTGGDANGKGKGVAESVKKAASDVVEETKQTVKDTGSRIADEVKATGESVVHQATSTLDQGKSQIASQIGGIAGAFRQASDQLRQEEQQTVADYSHRLGEQVQQVADYLEGKDARDIAHDVEKFARRQPGVFLGAALAVGLVAARFLKSSRPGEVR